MQETVIELSKTKLILLALAALAFVAIGVWMFTLDTETIEDGRRLSNPTLFYSLAIAAVLFFGAAGTWAIRKLFDKTPGLILSDEGFIDNSSGIAAGLIPWSEVASVAESQIQRQKFVSIHVHDPEKYIEKANTFKKAAHRANMKMVGTPINISAVSLKIKHKELLDLFQQYAAQS